MTSNSDSLHPRYKPGQKVQVVVAMFWRDGYGASEEGTVIRKKRGADNTYLVRTKSSTIAAYHATCLTPISPDKI